MWAIFYPGYLGVDVFLFLSGIGLCNSLNKNPVSTFYKNRFNRITPMFLVLSFFASVIFLLRGNNLSIWDWVCNLTSLSYYDLGGNFTDWYLCSIILIYLVSPLIFKIICNNYTGQKTFGVCVGGGYLCILLLMVLLIDMFTNFKWYHNTFIFRIPIFITGMLTWFDEKFLAEKGIILFFAYFVISVVLYSFGYGQTYFVIYMLAPIAILLTGLFVKAVEGYQKVSILIDYVGKHSIEIYVANCIVLKLSEYEYAISRTIIYILLNCIVSFFFLSKSTL